MTVARYREFVILLDKLKLQMATQCIQIEIVKDKLKEVNSFTEPEMMCCLNQMEQNGIIMIDENKIYFL